MTSRHGDTTITFHPDVPAIVCGECGFRTARIASLTGTEGQPTATVIVCLPCRERERVHTATSRARAAGRAVVPGQRRAPGLPVRGSATARQRCAPPPRTPVVARRDRVPGASPHPRG